MRQHPVCSHCKGRNVVADAWGSWDDEAQQWEIQTTFDNTACCSDCGGETSLEWVEEK